MGNLSKEGSRIADLVLVCFSSGARQMILREQDFVSVIMGGWGGNTCASDFSHPTGTYELEQGINGLKKKTLQWVDVPRF